MEIELNPKGLTAEIIIKSGNAKIEEDLAVVNKGEAHIPDSDIEKFIGIARDMNWFNGKSDVDFVEMIYNAYLNDSEREEFLDKIR